MEKGQIVDKLSHDATIIYKVCLVGRGKSKIIEFIFQNLKEKYTLQNVF